MLKKSNLIAILLLLAAIIGHTCESFTAKFSSVWLKRPHRGPLCTVEVIGADLDPDSNQRFDTWSKPDILVECRHSRWKRTTLIEVNTFKPRWLWQTKMPHNTKRGFGFTVYDVNVLKGNEVIGRAFISTKEAKKLQDSGRSKVLSLGEGIGSIKVKISNVPKDINKNIENIPEIETWKENVARIKA